MAGRVDFRHIDPYHRSVTWNWATTPLVLCALLACPTLCWDGVQAATCDLEAPHDDEAPRPCAEHSCFCDGSAVLTAPALTPGLTTAAFAVVTPAASADYEPAPRGAGAQWGAPHTGPPAPGALLPLLI
ncbi:MAG TPA: hypothetical protein PLP66_00845 [Phycisphaerae bacterium]|nr:hypothetical protein [Phycisphaerae bacterium]